MAGDITKNFSHKEFICPCGCNQVWMNKQSVERLQRVRDDYGKPIGIVKGGGYRCGDYDDSMSAHKEGRAFDISYPREDHFKLLSLAFKHGFTGIGDKMEGDSFQLHMDDAPAIPGKRPRPWKWTY